MRRPRFLMKTKTLLSFAAGGLLATVCVSAQTQPSSAELIERGRHLVQDVVGCGDCHTPRLPDGQLDPAKVMQGAVLGFKPLVEMPWNPAAPSVAGLVGRDDPTVLHVLTKGVRPDGSMPLPPMPGFRMSDDEAKAVIAYLRSLPSS